MVLIVGETSAHICTVVHSTYKLGNILFVRMSFSRQILDRDGPDRGRKPGSTLRLSSKCTNHTLVVRSSAQVSISFLDRDGPDLG